MGILKQLFGIEDIPQPTKHLSQKPPVRSPSPHEKDISEPVLSEPVRSIIQTLKDGEWSHKTIAGYTTELVIFKHEWFGNELTTHCFRRYVDENKIECQSEWMTQDEKEAVGSICWQIYQGRIQWEKEQSLAKQRESFMVLVKDTSKIAI